jgi:hypothetical protein
LVGLASAPIAQLVEHRSYTSMYAREAVVVGSIPTWSIFFYGVFLFKKSCFFKKLIIILFNIYIEMSETSVVCVKVDSIRKKGFHTLRDWMKNENNVYIGRRGVILLEPEGGGTRRRFPEQDSIWANPFKIDKNGTREDVIAKYEAYIREKLNKDATLVEELLKLKGKTLGCWCHPDPCHGDVLIKLIEEYGKKNEPPKSTSKNVNVEAKKNETVEAKKNAKPNEKTEPKKNETKKRKYKIAKATDSSLL